MLQKLLPPKSPTSCLSNRKLFYRPTIVYRLAKKKPQFERLETEPEPDNHPPQQRLHTEADLPKKRSTQALKKNVEISLR